MRSEQTVQPSRRWPRLPKIVRRFKSDKEGATAIEFAIVAGPFFLLIFSILETSLYFFASQYLENTIDDVTRKLRTGQLQHIDTAAKFKTEVCSSIVALFDCNNKMKLRVETAATFSDLSPPPGSDPNDYDSNGVIKDSEYFFQSPGPVEVVQVTATYLWPIYTNYAAPLTIGGNSSSALISATAVVRTEPFN